MCVSLSYRSAQATASQLQATAHALECSAAQQAALAQHLATAQAAAGAAAEEAAAELASARKQLQEACCSGNSSRTAAAQQLVDAEGRQQALEQRLTRAAEALALEQAAKAAAQQQVGLRQSVVLLHASMQCTRAAASSRRCWSFRPSWRRPASEQQQQTRAADVPRWTAVVRSA